MTEDPLHVVWEQQDTNSHEANAPLGILFPSMTYPAWGIHRDEFLHPYARKKKAREELRMPGVNLSDIPLTHTGSIAIPPSPVTPPPFETRVQLELGEYVHQQAVLLKERGIVMNEISQIFTCIKLAAKVVNKIITKLGAFGLDEAHCKKTSTTEDIADLAQIANKRFLEALMNREAAAGIATTHSDTIIPVHKCNDKNLVVLIHPMDGTKQIDVNVSSGTIFSVYKRITPPGTPVQLEDFLQCGKDQICAGYVLYGSSTIMVITMGMGVHGFTLDPSLGSFFLSHINVRIPERGNIYSVNGGKIKKFPYGVRAYIAYCQSKAISCRYIGSLVAAPCLFTATLPDIFRIYTRVFTPTQDFHRNMLKGGIYIYPPTYTDPIPSVSMIFQCFPLAFLAEQAGGKASDGFTRLLLIEPISLLDRVAFFCGSAHMVDGAEALMARYKIRDGGWRLPYRRNEDKKEEHADKEQADSRLSRVAGVIP